MSWPATSNGPSSGAGSPIDFVATYGCPFLYAECRLFYGSVLVAKGRWADAEQELGAGLRITEGACPALHDRALTRLAILRVRQGQSHLYSLRPGSSSHSHSGLESMCLRQIRRQEMRGLLKSVRC